MKKIAILMLITISLFAMEKSDISSVMESKINQATSIILQKELSSQEKAENILPLFNDVFDYKLMTKLSLGKSNWTKMSAHQREEFTAKFITHIKNSYVDKISLYTDEKLKIIKLEEINKKRIWLFTKLIGSKDSYDITYKFYKSKTDGWLIYDVDIIGISLIQIYRSQFNNILEDESYTTLLSKLEKKK
jgi:phospholipid transport system substrate-binding protein